MKQETQAVLVAAGWRPDWTVSQEKLHYWSRTLIGFPFHSAAETALRKFGGLELSAQGPGETTTAESVLLDPTLAVGEGDTFSREGARAGKSLFPLGEGGNGRFFVAIAEDGYVYIFADGMLYEVGSGVEVALANLVLGRRGKLLFSDY
jgi:hypothetical protein